MVQKLDRFQSEEILREVDASDEAQVVDESRARLKLVEEPPTFVEALAAHGIYDKGILMSIRTKDFAGMEFPPYGKGHAFAGAILGWTVYDVTTQTLKEIAEKLQLPLATESRLLQFKRALSVHGVTDRVTLMAFGVAGFRKKANKFPPFGGAKAFCKALFGQAIKNNVRVSDLQRIADALGFPKLSADDFRNALHSRGITDRVSLMHMGVENFWRNTFPPFGKGHAFATLVLGESLYTFNRSVFEKMLVKLELPRISSYSLHQFQEMFFSLRIYDKRTLRAIPMADIGRLQFPGYGGILAFAAVVLDDPALALNRKLLDRLAVRLRLPEDAGGEPSHIKCTDVYSFEPGGLKPGDEKFDLALERLERSGIYERKDIFRRGVDNFAQRNFKGFGIGLDFVSIVLGRKIDKLTEEDLGEFTDRLGFIDYGDYFYEGDDKNRLLPANGFGPEDTKGDV